MSETTWISFGSVVIGGAIAAGASFVATRQSHRYNRVLEQEKQKQQINGILRAIRQEFTISIRRCQVEVGDRLENVKEGMPFTFYFGMNREAFLVYPNNTSVVGQIDDSDLCVSIVTAYNRADTFLDSLQINCRNLEHWLELDKLEMKQKADAHARGMASFVPVLKDGLRDLKADGEKMIAKIDTYLKRHGD